MVSTGMGPENGGVQRAEMTKERGFVSQVQILGGETLPSSILVILQPCHH